MAADWMPGKGINFVFMEMQKIYQNKWLSQFSDEEHIRQMKWEWTLDLRTRCMEQVRAALEMCRRHLEWPPTSVIFAEMCIQTGLPPSPESAFRHAKIRNWPHPAVFAAFNRAGGTYAFTNHEESQVKQYFLEAYVQILNESSEKDDPNPAHLPTIKNNADSDQNNGGVNYPSDGGADRLTVNEKSVENGDKNIVRIGNKVYDFNKFNKSPADRAKEEQQLLEQKKEAQERRIRLIRMSDEYACNLFNTGQMSAADYYDRIRYLNQAGILPQKGNFNPETGEIYG